MKRKCRKITAVFKLKVALEALRRIQSNIVAASGKTYVLPSLVNSI